MAFFEKVVDIDHVFCVETMFVMFFAKNNDPFSICDGFLKVVRGISPDSKLIKKYGAEKIETPLIIKGKGSQFSVLKKPHVHSVCFRK